MCLGMHEWFQVCVNQCGCLALRTRSLKSQRRIWDSLMWAQQAGAPLQVDFGPKWAPRDGHGCPSRCPLSHCIRAVDGAQEAEPRP